MSGEHKKKIIYTVQSSNSNCKFSVNRTNEKKNGCEWTMTMHRMNYFLQSMQFEIFFHRWNQLISALFDSLAAISALI